MASSKSLSSTEKESQSFGNERDNFACFGCRSTGRFVHVLSAHAISKQIAHNTGRSDVLDLLTEPVCMFGFVHSLCLTVSSTVSAHIFVVYYCL